jgi:hypothetical protein
LKGRLKDTNTYRAECRRITAILGDQYAVPYLPQ